MRRINFDLSLRILIFLLVTLIGVIAGVLTDSIDQSSWLRSLAPVVTMVALFITAVLMVWQYRAEMANQANRPSWNPGRSPFPGLSSFTESDASVFFGRDAEVRALLDKVRPTDARGILRVVTVIGPSGVGKSSLVQAGLIPSLRSERMKWRVAPTIVPGDHPLASLALSFAAVNSTLSNTPAFPQRLRITPNAEGARSRLLFFVDQAEELFTLCDPSERQNFFDVIVRLLLENPEIWILFAVRSDFFTMFLQSADSHLFRSPIAVGALGADSLREVIERPAVAAGIEFDPIDLVAQIAADTSSGVALPLLSFTLQELYFARRGNKVTRSDYERLGGVRGVISRQADKISTELTGRNPEAPIISTLLNFVTVTGDMPTRRRVKASELGPEELAVARAFLAGRLLVSDSSSDDAYNENVLEVAHEALFDQWGPLHQQIENRIENLRQRGDLERWSQEWVSSGCRDSYLLTGERTTAAYQWLTTGEHPIRISPEGRSFIDRSMRADQATMRRLSENLSRQALAELERDPEHALRLAIAANEECAPTSLACQALTAAMSRASVRKLLMGHEQDACSVAWSPDGRRLASGSFDRTIRIWDSETGAELKVLRGHQDGVWSVAWSPDGRRLASGSFDRTARIWDSETGAELKVLRGHQDGVRGIAWSPDGSRVATGSYDSEVRVWNVPEGALVVSLQGHSDWVRAVAWSPNGHLIASGAYDKSVQIWDANLGHSLGSVQLPDSVHSVSWSHDSTKIAAALEDHTVRIVDIASDTVVTTVDGHGDVVYSVEWSPDDSQLVTGSFDHTVRIWDATTSGEIIAFRGHQDWVRCVTWSPDGKRVASGSFDRTVRVWDISPGDFMVTLYGHNGWVRCVAWSPEGSYIASGSFDRSVRIWDPLSGLCIKVLTGHNNWVRCVAWSSDGSHLLSASEDRSVRIWNPLTEDEPRILSGHEDGVVCCAWSPDDRRIASGSYDRFVKVWDAETGNELMTLSGHHDAIRSVAWSPDSRRIASGSYDCVVKVWDAETGNELMTLSGHHDAIRSVAWSPDGRRIASGSYDCVVKVWDAETGNELMTLSGHHDAIRCVAWSPDGRRIASGGQDHSVRIWDTEDGCEVMAFGHDSTLESVAWGPDSNWIAVACSDDHVYLWRVESREVILARARGGVLGNLSADERIGLGLPSVSPE
ncbi:hypothetical protein OG607_40935 [Streptomyces sp. NBC_01537]|uniref:nSTAND1 domain-containing NTPase n=1 Tax=Streptomyces sp. NBC_01537 TaxID=2903896 RepID=UPI00386CAEE1